VKQFYVIWHFLLIVLSSGLFARYDIPKGVVVVCYLGEYYERVNWDRKTRGFYSWEFPGDDSSTSRVLDSFEYRNVRTLLLLLAFLH
jgi:hypothetical protein